MPIRNDPIVKLCALLVILLCWALGASYAYAQTMRIEAESYSNAFDTTAGNQFTDPITACTYNGANVDVANSPEGTCKIGWVDGGEWLEYSVNIPTTGTYRLAYRYASGNTGAAGQIVFKSNGSTLATTSLNDGKGDWNTYTTHYLTVPLSAGSQTLRLEFISPTLDLNWFELTYATQAIASTGETQIEFEDYTSAYDTTAGNSGGSPSSCIYYGYDVDVFDNGGSDCGIGYITNGETLTYDVNIAEAGDYTVKYNYASPSGTPGQIQFKVDGSTVTTTTLTTNTGSYNTYATQTDTVTLPAGTHTVTTQFVSPNLNISWFSLEKIGGTSVIDIPATGTTQIESESYVAAYDTTAGNSMSNPATNCPYNGFDVDVGNGATVCEIGWIANGEWLSYDVNIAEAGDYTLIYRYGSPNNSPGQVQFKVDGSILTTTTLTTNTGNYSNYTTQSTTVTLPAGLHTLTTQFVNPVMNIDWFSLEKTNVVSGILIPASGETVIGFEEYVSAYDTTPGNDTSTTPTLCTYNGFDVDVFDSNTGTCAIAFVADGETLDFDVTIEEAGTYTVKYNFAGEGASPPGDIIFKLDGSTIRTTTLTTTTGSFGTYASDTDTLSLPAGAHTITIEFSNPWLNANWFSLEKNTTGGESSDSCSFPSAGAVSADTATIEVQNGAYIHDTPNNELVTKNMIAHADSCGSGITCTKTNTTAPVFTDVPTIPGGSNISTAASATQSLSPGDYGSLFANSNATINLQPGTYTFNGNVNINSDARITITSPGLTKIYINGRFDAGSNTRINSTGAAGTETLFIYASSGVAFQSGSQGYAAIYAKGQITLQNNLQFYGAVTSENYLLLGFGANLHYDENLILSTGYGVGCGTSAAPPTAQASWLMEQNWWSGSAGEVIDSSGSGLHGTLINDGSLPRIGRAVPALSGDPGSCNYGEFNDGQGYIRIDDPGSNSAFDVAEYSVAAWVYPTEYPSSDLSTIAHKGMMFELHLLPSGGLRADWHDGTDWKIFAPSGTVPLNQWTHIVYSFANGEQKLYLNGVLQGIGTTATGYVVDDEPFLIGYDLYPKTRGFKGRIDEVHFFSKRLSIGEVVALYGETHACPAATNVATAQWAFDESSWSGAAGEVRDTSGNGNHATAYSSGGFPNTSNTFPALPGNPGTCRYGDFFLGNDGYVAISDTGFSDFDTTELTLSAWVMPKTMPSGSATIVRKGNQYELVLSAAGVVSLRWQNSGTWNSISAPSSLTLNTWSHVAATFATGAQVLYVDGVEVATAAITKAFEFNDENVVVGYDFTTVTEAFDGFIDEVQIYGNVLPATDIASLATAARSGCPSKGFEDCHAIFPDALSNSVLGSPINFQPGTRVINSPDNILNTLSIADNGTVTCDTVDCTANGIAVPQLAAPTFTGGPSVTVPRNGSLSLSPGQYSTLTVRQNSILNLNTAGDYYFSGTGSISDLAQIVLNEEGTTRLYFGGGFFPDGLSVLNPNAGDTKILLVQVVGNVVLGKSSNGNNTYAYNTLVYASGFANLDPGMRLLGAMTAAGEIQLINGDTAAIYAPEVVLRADFTGTSCATTPSTTSLVAEWRFDETSQWNGTANELADSSGNVINGTAQNNGGFPELKYVGPAQGNLITGTCSYGDFNGSDGYFQINDPGSSSALDSTELTLAMWVYPTAYPPTTLSTLVSKDTHFEAHINSSGQVKFEWFSSGTWQNVTTTQVLPLNTWSHVAVTFAAGAQKVYINGVLSHSDTNANAMTANDNPIALGYDLNPTSRSFEGRLDEVRLYNGVLSLAEVQTAMTETRACNTAPLPTQITINAGASASTCNPHAVTLSIKNSVGDVITSYTGTVTLSTSTGHGNWSKTGNASDAYGTLTAGGSDSGSASYTFTSSDNGTVTLLLANARTENLIVSAVESVNAASGSSSVIGYTTNSYRAIDVTGGERVVGYPQVWRIEMMSKDPATGECSVNTRYEQSAVKAWLVRGANDAGGAAPTLVDSVTSASLAPPNGEPGSNNFNLTFVNGVAEFTVNTTDVLQATIYIADKTRSFADVDLAMTTGEQTYAPFGFHISVTGNPKAETAGGAVFKSAGQNFTVTARAVAWQALDDTDNDKIPDNHGANGQSERANLSDNTPLISFGKESPAETLTLASALLLPAAGNDPGLGEAVADARILTTFTVGSASTPNVYFDEVGIIELFAVISDGAYMGNATAAANSKSYSDSVGRFTPAYFNFGGNSLTEACQTGLDFSYFGQSFEGQFTVTPKSALGSSLQNYTGSFIKLGTGDFGFAARDINSGTELTGRLAGSVDSLNFTGGVATADTTFSIARAATPDGPYSQVSIGTDFSDSDSIALATADKNLDSDGDASNDAASLGEAELRYGRLRLASAHGPETAPLAVPMVVEYWRSPDWLINTDDSCSQIARADIRYPNGTIDFASNRTVSVASSSTTGSYSVIVGDAVQLTEGDSGLIFTAPGSGNMASFSTGVELTNYPWLRFDWNGDGNYSDSAVPDNTVNFGSYRGHDRMIFWQEY